MSAVLDLPVLDVNRLNQPIGERSVRAAITALTGISPAKAFDLEYARLPDGSYNLRELVSIRPVEWAEWITLTVRSCDRVILTTRGEMRAPEVISAPEFARMPMALPKLTPRGIYERDNWTCQYTGRRLPQDQLNIDHVIPLDRGGRDSWENLVACDRKINTWKANRLNSEAGLRLIRPPRAPRSVPRCALIRYARRPAWISFLTNPAD